MTQNNQSISERFNQCKCNKKGKRKPAEALAIIRALSRIGNNKELLRETGRG